MKSLISKRIIIIFSVLITLVASAVIVSFATGNTYFPSLSDPDGIFYERLDDQGNILYTITNKELFEEIKKNDGVQQLLFLVDTTLLKDYLDQLTTEEIQNRIKEMTYGTDDDTLIAELDPETVETREADFALNMTLAGYSGNEEAYASLSLAREKLARDKIVENGDVSDLNIAKEFINNQWEDIKAIRIRFMSAGDATNVMRELNLVAYNSTSLREYKGYIYSRETLLDNEDEIVEAYQTVTPYYFDAEDNILDLDEEIVYTKGAEGVYTDEDDNVYSLDESGNLLDQLSEVVIPFTLLFESITDAELYKETNTFYYSVSKTDPFDEDEDIIVKDSDDLLAFTIDPDGKIYDHLGVDVTSSTTLIVNKQYTPISEVSNITLNNSAELSDAEILTKYIQMYNYVYGDFRTNLSESATAEDLIAFDSEYLTFHYEDVKAMQASLATYMFKTLDLESDSIEPYSVTAKKYSGSSDNNHYMVYKLTQPQKFNAEEIMIDYIEDHIQIPTTIGSSITLPTSGWYGSTISWTPENSAIITNKGVVTAPEADTEVDMTYRISFNGSSRIGVITVTVLADGETVAITPSTDEVVEFKTILNNEAKYAELEQILVDGMVTSDSASTTIDKYLAQLRSEYGFVIHDRYLGLEYTGIDDEYVNDDKGDKTIVASLTGTPDAESTAFEITADDLFEYAVSKNSALYTLYASQYKELLQTTYFEQIFGTETDLQKNKSDRMQNLIAYVESIKDYYPQLQAYYAQLEAQYDIKSPYSSFQDYIYLEHNGAKTELNLLENAVKSSLQPYIITETVDDYDLLNLIYPTVEANFDNYFSLNVTHLLIHFDFDEDGKPDDYFEFVDGLDDVESPAFSSMRARLETAIREYLDESTNNNFTTLITAYQSASREDETWGEFKKYGIILLTQDLNYKDDENVSHSLQYSGEYGVKDSFVPEFTEALVDLYEEYSLSQNATKDNFYSELVNTENGTHIILATKGTNFTKPTTDFAEADPLNPVYHPALENPDEKPTIEQVEAYAEYYFYSQLYDLTEVGVEAKYGFTFPKIPATVRSALEFYSKDLISGMYVLGIININHADRMLDGRFSDTVYNERTNQELLDLLAETSQVYYDALFAKYNVSE